MRWFFDPVGFDRPSPKQGNAGNEPVDWKFQAAGPRITLD